MAPVFFVSYAQGDVEHPDFRETFVYFISELKHRVSIKLPHVASDDVEFNAARIQTGEVWSERLAKPRSRNARLG
jgi:hypothetical protein